MYIVTIQKKFVSGMLRSLEVKETVKFPTWHSADQYRQWAEKHTKDPVKPCVGSGDYIVEYAILEAA